MKKFNEFLNESFSDLETDTAYSYISDYFKAIFKKENINISTVVPDIRFYNRIDWHVNFKISYSFSDDSDILEKFMDAVDDLKTETKRLHDILVKYHIKSEYIFINYDSESIIFNLEIPPSEFDEKPLSNIIKSNKAINKFKL